ESLRDHARLQREPSTSECKARSFLLSSQQNPLCTTIDSGKAPWRRPSESKERGQLDEVGGGGWLAPAIGPRARKARFQMRHRERSRLRESPLRHPTDRLPGAREATRRPPRCRMGTGPPQSQVTMRTVRTAGEAAVAAAGA
ncbi:unnamed protein product, partial [Scytosiphon promiscuus]